MFLVFLKEKLEKVGEGSSRTHSYKLIRFGTASQITSKINIWLKLNYVVSWFESEQFYTQKIKLTRSLTIISTKFKKVKLLIYHDG